MTESILVIDDEKRISNLLSMYLEKEGYIIDICDNGLLGLEKAQKNDYSCVLLDINLPGMKGEKILSEIRSTKATPVIIISANSDEQSRVSGFEMGADDYIVKPFSPREVVLRVKAILQRAKIGGIYLPEFGVKNVLVYQDLIIDENAHKVMVAGEEVMLTPKEFDLLLFLVKSPDKLFTRKELLNSVWNSQVYVDIRTIDTHIKRLRKKISAHSTKVSSMITTVWRKGYIFDTNK